MDIHWRKSGGGGGGDGLYKYPPPPPTSWRKDNLKFDIYCKEIDLFNCKTIKNFFLNRSLAPLARTQMYSETRSLRFCQYMYSFLDIIYLNKGVE